jgi:hypothetical protein
MLDTRKRIGHSRDQSLHQKSPQIMLATASPTCEGLFAKHDCNPSYMATYACTNEDNLRMPSVSQRCQLPQLSCQQQPVTKR